MGDEWCKVSIHQIRYCKSAAWRQRIRRIWSTCWQLVLIGSHCCLSNVRHGPEERWWWPPSPRHGEDQKTVLLWSWFVGENCRIMQRDHGCKGWFGCQVRAGRCPDTAKANHQQVLQPGQTGCCRDVDTGKYDRIMDADPGKSVQHHYRHLQRRQRDHTKRQIGGRIVPRRILMDAAADHQP